MKTLLYPQWMTCDQQKYNIVSFLPAAEMDVSGLMRRLTWDLELGAGGQWSVVTISHQGDETGTIWTQCGQAPPLVLVRAFCSVRCAPSEHTLHNNSLVLNKFGQYRN